MARLEQEIERIVDGLNAPELPASLRIGPYDYTVRAVDELESLKTGFSGFCDKGELEIGIADFIPPQRKAEVALHEVIHACFQTGDLLEGEPGFTEEKIVTVLAQQLMQVVRDNPEFVAWFSENLKPRAA